MKIGLLGASFDTGNMGVSALAESSIKCILNRWPDAEIILMGSGYTPGQHRLSVMEKEICVRTVPIRFSKNIFLPYHFLKFVSYALLVKMSPWLRLKQFFANHNRYFRLLFETDLVADMAGGDSFSGIYGFRRFFLRFLCEWLVIFLGKKLVLLPQTYGPFKRPLTQKMARYVLKHANLVYSRDQASIEYLKNALNIDANSGKVRFAPDLAFILDSRKPDNFDTTLLPKAKDGNNTLVGLNISGLLFNGGYTKDNMFGLKTDYRSLIHKIIDLFTDEKKVVIILVPHVFPPTGWEVESDPEACRKTYELIKEKYKERILLVDGKYNHNEIKYIIGLCDFFIGSRMHACIAAISQNIQTVGLAYSKKFEGVFSQVGIANLSIDLRTETESTILSHITEAYNSRNKITQKLSLSVPETKRKVLSLFENVY